jgi:hypothetical protein
MTSLAPPPGLLAFATPLFSIEREIEAVGCDEQRQPGR